MEWVKSSGGRSPERLVLGLSGSTLGVKMKNFNFLLQVMEAGNKASIGELRKALKYCTGEFEDFKAELLERIGRHELPKIEKLKSLALGGDTDAALEIGLRFLSFEAHEDAKNWLTLSSEQGNIDAICELGRLGLRTGETKWLEVGVSKDSKDCVEILMDHFLGSKWDIDKQGSALDLFPKAIKMGVKTEGEYLDLLLKIGTVERLRMFADSLEYENYSSIAENLGRLSRWHDEEETPLTREDFGWAILRDGTLRQTEFALELLYPIVKSKNVEGIWQIALALKARRMTAKAMYYMDLSQKLLKVQQSKKG